MTTQTTIRTAAVWDVVGIGAVNTDFVLNESGYSAASSKVRQQFAGEVEMGHEKHIKDVRLIDRYISSFGRDRLRVYIGGSALNTIRAINALDADLSLAYVGVAGTLNDDLRIVSTLDRVGIDTSLVATVDSERSGICLSYSSRGKRTLLTHAGANRHFAAHIAKQRQPIRDMLTRARWIHVTSLLDSRSPRALLNLLTEIRLANPASTISIDPGYEWARLCAESPALRGLLGLADILYLNNDEFNLLGAPGADDVETAHNVYELLSIARTSLLLVVKRYDLTLVVSRSQVDGTLTVEDYPAERISASETINDTGAGDIFAAGVIVSRLLSPLRYETVGSGINLGSSMVRAKLLSQDEASYNQFPDLLARSAGSPHERPQLTNTQRAVDVVVSRSVADAARFDGDVSVSDLAAWLSQVDPNDQDLLRTMITGFTYYSLRKFRESIRQLHLRVTALLGDALGEALFVPIPAYAGRGGVLAYFYRHVTGIPARRFVTLDEITTRATERVRAVVFVDELIRTGAMAEAVWASQAIALRAESTDVRLVLASVVAYEHGLAMVADKTDFEVAYGDLIGPEGIPFATDSKLFPMVSDRERAISLVDRYERILGSNRPHFAADERTLLSFFYTTPPSTPRLFWRAGEDWTPLLGAGSAPADTVETAVEHSSSGGEAAGGLPTAALADPVALDPDAMEPLFKEFKLWANLKAVVPAFEAAGLPATVLPIFLRAAHRLKLLRHENRPVESALMIAPSGINLSAGRGLTAETEDSSELSVEGIEDLALLAPGTRSAVAVTSDGRLVGVYEYPVVSRPEIDRMGPTRLANAASASRALGTIILVFDGKGKGSMFWRGRRLLVYRADSWHSQPLDLESIITELEGIHGFREGLIRRSLELAVEVSDRDLACLMTLGDETAVMSVATDMGAIALRWAPRSLFDQETESLLALLGNDGATIVAASGAVLAGRLRLSPPADTVAENEPGRGTRHRTAAQVSAATNAVAVVVSSDGRITVYSKGRSHIKVMG